MKILVVEDHVLMREALRGVLKELKGDAAVIIEAPDSRQAMRQIEQNPDVELVLLDLGLPDRDGFEILSEFAERYPTISVVVHSAHQDRERVMKALDLGAIGFIPKSAQREVMLSAFNLIFSGGIYIPPEILDRRQATPMSAQTRPASSLKPRASDGGSGPDRAADGGASPDDAGQEQQGYLSRARPGRADRENSCFCDPQGPEGGQPHRSRPHSRRAWPRTAAGC
jgi:DNA-binding NarL/FixJ family response regulator